MTIKQSLPIVEKTLNSNSDKVLDIETKMSTLEKKIVDVETTCSCMNSEFESNKKSVNPSKDIKKLSSTCNELEKKKHTHTNFTRSNKI